MNSNKLYISGDGSHSILSGRFGESYHSRHGAIQESRHVFINMGLLHRSQSIDKIRILEFGFGTGLNAALSWLYALANSAVTIHYVGIEKYPISVTTSTQLNYAEKLAMPAFHKLHELDWDTDYQLTPNFSFTKLLKDFSQVQLDPLFDLIYYDPFAPGCQPEMWESGRLESVINTMAPNGILVTYCAKGSFRRALIKVGFKVERLPGPPGKREMLRAIRVGP